MKKTLYTIAAALCLTGGALFTASCNLGSAGQLLSTAGGAVATAALNNYVTTGSLTGGDLATAALQSIMKDQEMANVLGTVANNLVQNYTQRGTTFNYSGQASLEALSGTFEPMAYNTVGKATPTLDIALTTNKKTIAESTTAQLVIPAYTVSTTQTTALTVTGLGVTTNGTTSTISLTDNSAFGAGCTLTYNGQTHEATTLYITEAKVLAGTLTLNMTIYYGKEYTNPVNLTYTGALK